MCPNVPGSGSCGGVATNTARTDDYVRDILLTALDSPALAERIHHDGGDDDNLADAVRADEELLEELAHAWASREISRREWMAARAPIELRLDKTRAQLASLSRTSPLIQRAVNDDLHQRCIDAEGGAFAGQWQADADQLACDVDASGAGDLPVDLHDGVGGQRAQRQGGGRRRSAGAPALGHQPGQIALGEEYRMGLEKLLSGEDVHGGGRDPDGHLLPGPRASQPDLPEHHPQGRPRVRVWCSRPRHRLGDPSP
ncbi:hypothetical protein Misp03_28500 [Microbispora sp. NBRC 16548]|nr:hypothetical protein Misp03_28500 [Microbispora sp. NBRC 16548]